MNPKVGMDPKVGVNPKVGVRPCPFHAKDAPLAEETQNMVPPTAGTVHLASIAKKESAMTVQPVNGAVLLR